MAALAVISLLYTLQPGQAPCAGTGAAGQRLNGRRVLRGWLAAAGVLALGLALMRLFWPDYFSICLLMAKIDLFAFGGGYVSVPLMLHEFVAVHGWMSQQVFMDGIALGQITPGPIVITAAFVGYYLKGLPASLLAAIYMFAPSFLIVVGSAPLCGPAAAARAGPPAHCRARSSAWWGSWAPSP